MSHCKNEDFLQVSARSPLSTGIVEIASVGLP